MAIKWELTADATRGPGFGLLKTAGMPLVSGPVRLWIQRNQGAEPFLGQNRTWVTQPVQHELPPPEVQDGQSSFVLGPDLVDPIALLPPNCLVLIGLETDGLKDQGRATVRRLLPSVAAGEGGGGDANVVRHITASSTSQTEDETVPPVEPLVVDPPPPVVGKPPKFGIPPMALGLIAAVLLGGGAAGLYFSGILGGETKKNEPMRDVGVVAAKPVDAAIDGAIDSREALARYLASNPSAAAAFAKAKELDGQGRRDFAMLVYQHGSRQGSAEASLTLGRMYDPDTWSKQTSPMERPDAETAAYWYEPAARAGNVEAQRRLGKILISLPQGGIQKDKGKEWLTKAAEAGDAEAKTLLAALK